MIQDLIVAERQDGITVAYTGGGRFKPTHPTLSCEEDFPSMSDAMWWVDMNWIPPRPSEKKPAPAPERVRTPSNSTGGSSMVSRRLLAHAWKTPIVCQG